MITSKKHKHVPILRRQREQKTNYRKRKSAIISRETLLVVRISNKQTNIQFIVPRIKGDVVKSSTNSSHLKSLGWEYSGKNMPGAYLTGYLAGKKAMKSGIKSSILYLGVTSFKPKSRTFSAVKGLIDAGVEIPVNEDILPDEKRLYGEHISSDYEKVLKTTLSAIDSNVGGTKT